MMACSTVQPLLKKDKLNEYWGGLTEMIKLNKEEDIMYFCHCTRIRARDGITSKGVIYGSSTDFPSSAPLASNEEMTGTWFSLSSAELPSKSPYGTQRIKFPSHDFMSYLTEKGQNTNSNDPINSTGESAMLEDGKVAKEPMLFFECAHHYGKRQYARLLLVRASDPMVAWCKSMCKEINLSDNPFLKYSNERVRSRAHGSWIDVTVDVFVAGDIHLDQMKHRPRWDKVGTLTRAGVDPVLGLC
ncbi:uncharacterized protein LOC128553857 [Mercenaria mercenaria]|uniref:uncharacterized protein LOC128553857 n=1 Tax=Mercenaria mercenaria TaxID=6596 RepID=UPI00234F7B0D|nr:uncharacterized protein LOC128553857 [Mercenaria mercenaria]